MNKKVASGTMLALLFIGVLTSATASDESAYAHVETLSSQSHLSTVSWTMEPSSIVLFVLPGKSADIVVTINNDPSSDAYWRWTSMFFGSWFGQFMDFMGFKFPPQIAPGDSWTGPVGTVYVYPTTPEGTIVTRPGCRLKISGPFSDGQWTWGHVLVTVIAGMPLSATMDIDPDTLNLKSKVKWITCYIELPEGYNVSDTDVSTIRLNNTISVDLEAPINIGDYDEDGIPDLVVKFDTTEVMALLSVGEATLTITGEVSGALFEGSDTIKVIHK